MNWKKYFREKIITRGYQYYRTGSVMDLTYDYDYECYTASVIGRDEYGVEIGVHEGQLTYMECSCPYAMDGNHCKHMAAVLYEIESQGDFEKIESVEPEVFVQPFCREEDTYHYFDMTESTEGWEFTEKSYQEAEKLLEKEKVVLENVVFSFHSYYSDDVKIGIGEGYYQNRGRKELLRIIFQKTGILRTDCNVRDCPKYHYSRNYYPTKANQPTDLIRMYENGERILFGTKTEIDLSVHRMREESEPLYEYVKGIVKEEQYRVELARKNYRYTEEEEVKNKIVLYGNRLDQLFDLLKEKEVVCNGLDGSMGRGKQKVLLCDGKPEVVLSIEKDVDVGQTFHGILVQGTAPKLIEGENYRYFFKDNKFCRVKEEELKDVLPLFDCNHYGEISLRVGRKHLAEFYHQILPVLKEQVTVNEREPEYIADFVPPEAVYSFYLDAQNGIMSCRIKASYGDQEISVLHNLCGNIPYEEFRNISQEDNIIRKTRMLFPNLDISQEELQSGSLDEDIVRIVDGGVNRLMKLGEVHTTDRFCNVHIRRSPKLKVGASIERDYEVPASLGNVMRNYQIQGYKWLRVFGVIKEIRKKQSTS